MGAPRLLCLLAALLLGVVPPSAIAGPLDFDGAPADQILLTWSTVAPEQEFQQSAMLNRVVGIGLVADAALRRRLAVPSRRAPEVGWPRELRDLAYLHVSRRDQRRVCAFARTPDGIILVRTLGADPEPCHEFPEAIFEDLLRAADVYGGPVPTPQPIADLGVVEAFPTPLRPSRIILDEATLGERLFAGRPASWPATDRSLPDTPFYFRLPTSLDPRVPCGLLVWISATPEGRPPRDFDMAADRLNLIVIGAARSGNTEQRANRYQLALDGAAMAQRLFFIDPRRVYVTGISGGGRISSDLAACFPDVFTGSVPIVGIHTHRPVPLGDGRFIRNGYIKPTGQRWRSFCEHRMAAVTGPLDFNYREIVSAVRILDRAGVAVRLFEYEDMAHTLPTPERFVEALSWVDEPVARADADARESAAGLLESYLRQFGELPVTTDAQRRVLEQIAAGAPWSPPAWRACEILGLVPARPHQTP